MKYSDLSINLGFKKNMQETNWLKLFPKWWAENDPLIEAIGKEIAYIKAQSIFALLNTTIKPPVMIWQNSIVHKEYVENFSIKQLPEIVKLPAPFYKTFGYIKIINHTENDIENLKISFNSNDGIIIQDIISENDEIRINAKKVTINDKEANFTIYGDGLSCFKTSQNKSEFIPKITEIIGDNNNIILNIFVPNDYDGYISINNQYKKEVANISLKDKAKNIKSGDECVQIDTQTSKASDAKFYINLYNSSNYYDISVNSVNEKFKINKKNTELHNETVKILFESNQKNIDINFDVDIVYENVVFINEQNIEVTGLELIPIDKVELYAYYDFPYNQESTGWRKVYEKKYQENTNVIYDMITTHFYTKKFYVDVWYKGLDYPYRVGFPAFKDAEKDSIYHINTHIDEWGKYFGMPRRVYKTNIPEEDYPFTYPEYYPFDIEQDYWYYQRLINEYTYNDLAINEIDLVDTDDTPVLRLHSINPFVEDFVVYAESKYPTKRENIDFNYFIPNWINQRSVEADYKRVQYFDTHNLLKYDKNKAHITLRNKAGTFITAQKYLSKQLETFFDLSYIPSDVNIEDIKIIVEAESTDNSLDKYSNNETGIIIHGINENEVFLMTQSDNYELEEKKIEYTLSDGIDKIKKLYTKTNINVTQEGIIEGFATKQDNDYIIPFILKENDEIINDITDVYVIYHGLEQYIGNKSYECEYIIDNNDTYIKCHMPRIIPAKKVIDFDLNNIDNLSMDIICKTEEHHSFIAKNIQIKAQKSEDQDESDNLIKDLEFIGPYKDDTKLEILHITDDWHTGDLRNILQKDGISFINTFQNDSETNTPTILIKNIRLEIDYSPKKTNFKLETQIRKDKVEAPAIAQLEVIVTNIGDKDFKSNVDIVCVTNLKLSKHYFDFDLSIGESATETIDITPEFPILDGQYEILTVCEDKTAQNSIVLSSSGLIKTGIILKQHYGKYNESITLKASITNAGKFNINDGKISFYIDDFYVGEGDVQNNEASIIFIPNNNKYVDAGMHDLEARFSGTSKFASSRIRSSILISRNTTIIDLVAKDTTIFDKPYTITSYVKSSETDDIINEGFITYYLNSIKIGVVEVNYGIAEIYFDNFTYEPNRYQLTAIYSGTELYTYAEAKKKINIIGGDTNTTVFDINAKPSDTVTLKARVTDINNKPLSVGHIKFSLSHNNDIQVIGNANVEYGVAIIDYTISSTILRDAPTFEYQIIAEYVDDTNIYQNSSNTGTLYIEQGEVKIYAQNVFFASQHEPLGFYILVLDAKTNKPVSDGQITINIPMAYGIETVTVPLDNDGGARIIYNPINITADEFKQLLKFSFKRGNQITNGIPEDLYRVYDGRLEELDLMDFEIKDKHLVYHIYDENSSSGAFGDDTNTFENVFIHTDGHLYARTNIDTIRKYKEGTYNINIDYTSEAKYKNNNTQSIIQLQPSIINIDIHSDTVTYGDMSKSIICYVNEYNLDINVDTVSVNEGKVLFIVDNTEITTSNIVEGRALLSTNFLDDIPYGHHLLTAKYLSDNNRTTYTYADLIVKPITSTIHGTLNKERKNEKSKLTTILSISDQYQIPITGDINIYIDNELIQTKQLSTTYDSTITSEFMVLMPDDIDIEKHILTIEYTGDMHILPTTETIVLKEKPLPVYIDTYDIYVAQNENCHIRYYLEPFDEDIINDGEVCLYKGSKNLQAKGYVKNNIATLDWKVTDAPSNEPYLYTVKYMNGDKYESPSEPIIQNIYVVEAQDDVYIAQDENNSEIPYDYTSPVFKSFSEALQCVKAEGNIHILDYVNLNENVIINKDINIIGSNDAQIIKDLPNILSTDIGALKIYDFEDFNQDINEIVGMTINHLNIIDFHILEADLFFVQDTNLKPIFLLSDGKFYSYERLSLGTIISNIGLTFNGEVNIKNIHFTSNDSKNMHDLVIKINKDCTFYKTIIEDTITINNQKNLTVNNSLVYGNIIGSKAYNLDNNWWGSNAEPLYNVNNQLKLHISTDNDPPIIGDEIQIYASLINETDEYTDHEARDIPSLSYIFEAESGLFSSKQGKMINGQAYTTYFDGYEECTVYCTVDDETVSLDILNYDRKTEILLEPIIDIPINYQISIKAKIQSVADTYYKIDEQGIIQTGNTINNGYIDFYINNKKIGHARVIDGEATLPVFFSAQQYPITNNGIQQYQITLNTIYRSDDYYFGCEKEQTINLINGNQVCFVSPDAEESGNGSFNTPFDSITKAILSNKNRIYLKEGIYSDNQINITGVKDIRAYNGECIFENNNIAIFNCNATSNLSLTGLTFRNNKTYIINNSYNLNIQECVFYNNQTNYIIKNRTTGHTNIQDSVILNQNRILYYYQTQYSYDINYCWFGTNTPSLQDKITNHIVMQFISSREPIYIGTVVHLIASINHYKYNGGEYLTDHHIPLRIANFYSEYGSLMPMHDYTYDNKANSFLNTNEESISNWIITWPLDNTNYINKPITLKCKVSDFYDNPVNIGEVRFNIIDDENNIITVIGEIQDGIATGNLDIGLPKGEYTLFLYYNDEEQKKTYSTQTSFKVIKPILTVTEFDIEKNDYVYDMSFNLKVTDSFNNQSIDQDVSIYIDNQYIGQNKIINNTLNAHITYNPLELGTHILKIVTNNVDSIYDDFIYTQTFTVTKKDTYISFDYLGLTQNEPTDLIIKVYDKGGRLVQNGTIDIKYDNETVYVDNQSKYTTEDTEYDTIILQNGIGIIYGFYSEQGQHSIAIHYNGDNTIYNSCLYTNSNFNVSLDEVVIESQELLNQLSVNIGHTFTLNFPITDTYGNSVKRGYINLYLDNSTTSLNNEPLMVNNGYVAFEGSLPLETKAMLHNFTINYIDTSYKYLPTTYHTKINVHPIPTQILIDPINTAPNHTISVPFTVESEYGAVTTGKIKAYYNNELLSTADVSNINTQINLTIPMLSSIDTYNIVFKYEDTIQNTYMNSEETVVLSIMPLQVNITPQINKYYPKNNFDYIINITDDNDNIIEFGNVTLYIDNVKIKTKEVHNGTVSIPLHFDTVKTYQFNIIYEENEYYSYTSKIETFSIESMDITDIYIENTTSIPNTILDTILYITTPNDLNVTDGFIDFYLDNNKINTFAVVEDTKYIELNIPNIDAGTYEMKMKYYDSEFFKECEFIHNFTITKQNIHMTVPATYTAQLNDTITFTTNITETIEGILEYYLIAIDENTQNSRFIGIEQINNKHTIDFEYRLPNNLEKNNNMQYKICVKFLGNTQYYEQEKSFILNIEKMQPEFTELYVTSEVEYETNVNISAKVNISNATMIYFYLDTTNNLIGSKRSDDTNEYDYINMSYTLNDEYVPGSTHTIIAMIKESVTLEETSINKNFTITKSTPTINTTLIEAYVGQKIILPTNIVDNKGNDVTTGTLTYKIGSTTIATCSPNAHKEYQLDNTYQPTKEITVSYVAESNGYYKDFNDIITIELQKNSIYFSLDVDTPVTRGIPAELNLQVSSPTTNNLSGITYKIFLEDTQITSLSPLTIPITFPDQPTYTITIQYDGNSMFNAKTQTFTLINQNEEQIILSNIHDLELAFSLVANNGTININENTNNAQIINYKNVTLRGNTYLLHNCTIENYGKLHMIETHFKGSTDSIIKNNGELYATNCTFENGNAQYGAAIYIDNKNINTQIIKCTFINNYASLYGGAIFSNKGNDVSIQSCRFYSGNRANVKGSSISSNGNIDISQNMFYNNYGTNEIYLIDGNSIVENNYFDASIKAIENKSNLSCNLNYWGYNEFTNIQNNISGDIDFDTWLISTYEILDYREPIQNEIHTIFTVKINRYRNRIDNTESMYEDVIDTVPIKVNDNTEYLNTEIDSSANNINIIVGKQHITIGD